jgi:hypothetical protein
MRYIRDILHVCVRYLIFQCIDHKIADAIFSESAFRYLLLQNKRMNEYNGISATKIVQIYKHTFFKILLTG